MEVLNDRGYVSFDPKWMEEVKAIRLDENEKTVKDVIEGFKELIYPSTPKWCLLIEDDGVTYGYLKPNDVVLLPGYLNREVSGARLQRSKWDEEYCLKIYLKPLTKRKIIFFEISEGDLEDSNLMSMLRSLIFSAHANGYYVHLLVMTDHAFDIKRDLHSKNIFVDGITSELPENGNYYIFKCERSNKQ